MSTIIEILKKANIPSHLAIELESELDKKFVAKDPFPPLKWDKEVLMPLQQEQFKASERIQQLSERLDLKFDVLNQRIFTVDSKIDALESKMDSKFEAFESRMDSKFGALESKMDSKFEALESKMDSKYDSLESKMDSKYDSLDSKMDSKFEAIEVRLIGFQSELVSLRNEFQARFLAIDDRFKSLDIRLENQKWMMGLMITLQGLMLAIFAKHFL